MQRRPLEASTNHHGKDGVRDGCHFRFTVATDPVRPRRRQSALPAAHSPTNPALSGQAGGGSAPRHQRRMRHAAAVAKPHRQGRKGVRAKPRRPPAPVRRHVHEETGQARDVSHTSLRRTGIWVATRGGHLDLSRSRRPTTRGVQGGVLMRRPSTESRWTVRGTLTD